MLKPEEIDQLTDTLSKSLVFKGVPTADLRTLVGAMEERHLTAKQILFRKDDINDTQMYILINGKLRIYTEDAEGNQLTLADYDTVHLFGDFSMLDERPRSATAEAVTDIDVLSLTRADFIRLLPECPDLGMVMLRNMTDRVRHITDYRVNVENFVSYLAKGNYDGALKQLETSSDDKKIQNMIADSVRMVREKLGALKFSAVQPAQVEPDPDDDATSPYLAVNR